MLLGSHESTMLLYRSLDSINPEAEFSEYARLDEDSWDCVFIYV